MRSFSIVCVLFYTVAMSLPGLASELSYHVNYDSNIVVVNHATQDPVRLFGTEFRSAEGHLRYGSAFPFGIALAPDETYIPLVDPNGAVGIDGSVTFDVKYSGINPASDLSVVMAPAADQNLPSLVPAPYVPEGRAFSSVSLGMTGDHHWTVRASNESLMNLRISSPSGSLVPGNSAAPFYNLLESTPHAIQYGAAASAVKLDGTIKLDSRWDSGGQKDVSYAATTSQGTFDPVRVPPSVYGGPPKSPLHVRVDQNANNTVMLFGIGQEVEDFQINSPSGSLLVADNPAPFGAHSQINSTKVAFDGASIIDGSMNTNVRYNPTVGGQDVSYSYKLVGVDEQFGGALAFEPPPGIDVSIDQTKAEFPLVLTGNGQQLGNFAVSSNRGSLKSGNSPAPFSSFTHKTNKRVELTAATNVTIDGNVTTNIFYNGEVDGRDLRYEYQMGAEPSPRTGRIADADYPNVRNLNVEIGSDARSSILLRGSGQSLEGFELTSPSGSLLVGDDPSPLGTFAERNAKRVSLVGSSPVTIDGTVTTDIRYNKFVNGRDLEFSYDLLGVEPREGRIASYPTATSAEKVGVHILEADDGTFPIALSGVGQPLVGVSFTSAGGSLLAGNTPDPFESFVANTANHVAFESDSPLVIDGLVTTNAFYNKGVDSKDVQFSYETRTSDEIEVYPGDPKDPVFPQSDGLAAHLDGNGNIVVTNLSSVNPLKLFGAEFRSEAGLLQFGSASPFPMAFGPSSTYVPIADPRGETQIDGSATFDIKYLGSLNDLLNGDLTVTISPVTGQGQGFQVTAPVFAFDNNSTDTVLPEPSGQLLGLLAFVGSLVLRRRR